MYVTDLANGKYDSSRLDMSVGYEIKTISNFVRINGAVYRVTPAAVGIVTEITSRYILAGGKKATCLIFPGMSVVRVGR